MKDENTKRAALQHDAPGRDFISVPDWPKYPPWLSEYGLMHLIFNRETNGFNQIIRRTGRRILMDEEAFLEWFDQRQNSRAGKGSRK
jgi:hypothetical protein